MKKSCPVTLCITSATLSQCVYVVLRMFLCLFAGGSSQTLPKGLGTEESEQTQHQARFTDKRQVLSAWLDTQHYLAYITSYQVFTLGIVPNIPKSDEYCYSILVVEFSIKKNILQNMVKLFNFMDTKLFGLPTMDMFVDT